MLSHNILIKCLKGVNCLIVRKKSVIIRQIDTTKLTKAQRLKKTNYETSALFGSKIKNQKEVTTQEKDEKGINAEIYWTLTSAEKQKETEATKEPKKKSPKKASSAKKKELADEKLPQTFAKFKLDLPRPVKVTIQDALNNIDSQINSTTDGQLARKNEIPFSDALLKSMINFPLIIEKNDLVYDMFSKAEVPHPNFTPSVSKILQATMPPSQRKALQQWKNLKIAELGLKGFEDMQKSYLTRGKKFHECLQKYFNNEEMSEDDVSMDVIEVWKSISHVIKDFKVPATLTEHHINHPFLHYKGIVDCVAVHNKQLSIIEWKNSDRYKKSVTETFDAPLQLCAYLSALNSTEFRDNPLTSGIIVVAYNDGQGADLFHLSSNELKKYWRVWLSRLQDYWIRYRDNTLSLEDV